jgi:hypothetical protein
MKRTIEAKRVQISENLEKGFLIHVAGFLGRPEEVGGQAEHTLVVRPHEALESVVVALLGCPDQACFV